MIAQAPRTRRRRARGGSSAAGPARRAVQREQQRDERDGHARRPARGGPPPRRSPSVLWALPPLAPPPWTKRTTTRWKPRARANARGCERRGGGGAPTPRGGGAEEARAPDACELARGGCAEDGAGGAWGASAYRPSAPLPEAAAPTPAPAPTTTTTTRARAHCARREQRRVDAYRHHWRRAGHAAGCVAIYIPIHIRTVNLHLRPPDIAFHVLAVLLFLAAHAHAQRQRLNTEPQSCRSLTLLWLPSTPPIVAILHLHNSHQRLRSAPSSFHHQRIPSQHRERRWSCSKAPPLALLAIVVPLSALRALPIRCSGPVFLTVGTIVYSYCFPC